MRIRNMKVPALGMAVMVAGICTSVRCPARADDGKLDGSWKLLLLPRGDDEIAILKLSSQDGNETASIIDAQQMVLGRPNLKKFERKGDRLAFSLDGPGGETTFEGTLAGKGPNEGKFCGMCRFRGGTYPARLEKTTQTKVAPLQQNPLLAEYAAAVRDRDPKSRVKRLEELLKGTHGAPYSEPIYAALLQAADAAGLDAQRVGDLVNQWIEGAKPYGESWYQDVQLKALRAMGLSKSYAKVRIALAQEIETRMKHDAAEKTAEVLEILADTARVAGMADLANDAVARLAKLDGKLDEEYHTKVPPFKPTPYAGRKKSGENRVVLMELFTGAQCGPCIAADVAFDALLATYEPTEFIGLEYHLHIPGPDPLTNHDSIARQHYYGDKIRGTPATFFNGRSDAGGGGPMGIAQRKYTQYRGIIDRTLESETTARIDLSASRTGDEVKIVASAKVPADGAESKSNGLRSEKARRFLRLALTESSVRYVGRNKLRFHHHVVRALPGGAAGKELVGGSAEVEFTVKLAALRHDLETYLSDFAKSTMPFPGTPPDIKLADLAVVAFVQDDADQSVLHAVSVPVKPAKP